MLENRDYMRQPEPYEPRWSPRLRWRWSWTIWLLVAYTAVFLAGLVANHFFPENPVFNTRLVETNAGVAVEPGWLPLSVEGLGRGFVWQLVTYQFLHAGWLHLLFNGWAIFLFGRELEELLGGKKFLALVFSSGIVGGFFQVLVALLWPQYFGGPVVGASACAFGLVAVFALLFPERELTLLVFFFIPVRLSAKMLLYGSAALAVAGFALPTLIMPGTAHAAHLGGMAMGWFFVRKILPGGWSLPVDGLRPAGNSLSRRPGREPLENLPGGDFIASEVDPILEKISAHGIQSLTTRERETLEKARAKMARH
jgi:membrane associated rhomboid family serine protease